MHRGARSTCTPRRASSYSGTPLRFSAEYIGGVCHTSPVYRRSTSSSAAASTGGTGSRRVTVPVRSSVSVSTPSRMVPSYVFRSVIRNADNFVPAPMQTGSTPLANGSSVPRWPIFSARSARFSTRTMCADVGPSGLSMSRIPSSPVMRVRPVSACGTGIPDG